MENNQYLVTVIVILVVLFLIFLLIRELNCWYWKINNRIELTKQTNILLEKIYRQLGGVIEKEKIVPFEEKLRGIEGLDINNYETLSIKEKEDLYLHLTYTGVTTGEIIAINNVSRKIKRFSGKQWSDLINKKENDNWLILVNRLK